MLTIKYKWALVLRPFGVCGSIALVEILKREIITPANKQRICLTNENGVTCSFAFIFHASMCTAYTLLLLLVGKKYPN